MKTLKFTLLLLVTVCFSFVLHEVQWTSISKEDLAKAFEQVGDKYKNSASYSMNVTHASYESYTDVKPHQRSKGYFKKEGNNYHSMLLGIHTLQNERCKLIVDSAKKVILVSDPDKSMQKDPVAINYASLLSIYSALKYAASGKDKYYRIETKQNNPIAAYEYIIDGSGFMKDIVFYYRAVKKEPGASGSETLSPRLHIEFSAFAENIKFNYQQEFDENRYIMKKEKKYVLREPYQDYQLLDQRIKK